MSDSDPSKKRALVIEDEPVIGRLCRKILTAEGFEVDIASNGLAAKGMADKTVYDLYLSDIRTPVMNGIEFYRHLKEQHPELAERVIFTTGDVMSADVRTLLEEFKGTFVPKPFTPDELRIAVKEAQLDCTKR